MSAENNLNTTTSYDVIIIGSGPAGYSAGVYTARAELKVAIFEGPQSGGQLITTTDVENFLGTEAINGFDLTEKFKSHAIHCGASTIPKIITAVNFENPHALQVTDEDGIVYTAKAVIICTGATAKRLAIKGEDLYWQKGISACAVCDGAAPIFRKKPLAVNGGGDTACEEAMFLTKFASKVYVILRRDQFRASKVMASRVLNNPKIQVVYNTVIEEAHGSANGTLDSISVVNVKTNEKSTLQVNGLFYAIGHNPNTAIFKGVIDLDVDGYVVPAEKGTTKTNKPGVFAAGDVMDKKYRQAITAAGFGCMAAKEVEDWLVSLE